MCRLNAYLNFQGNTEKAFIFYQMIFGGELFLLRFKDAPNFPGKDLLDESDLNKVMNASLTFDDNVLMATDMLESMGQYLLPGNGYTLALHPESKEEGDWLYEGLSRGGQALSPMAELHWGYWGMLTDKFGVQWMINVARD